MRARRWLKYWLCKSQCNFARSSTLVNFDLRYLLWIHVCVSRSHTNALRPFCDHMSNCHIGHKNITLTAQSQRKLHLSPFSIHFFVHHESNIGIWSCTVEEANFVFTHLHYVHDSALNVTEIWMQSEVPHFIRLSRSTTDQALSDSWVWRYVAVICLSHSV